MKKLLLALVPAMMMVGAYADDVATDSDASDRFATPLEINLASPLQIPFYLRDVYGLRLNLIYGRSFNVYGLDVGVVGVNSASLIGLQAEGFNWVSANMTGVQLGAIANVVLKHAYGLQVASIVNSVHEESAGVMAGLLDFTMGYDGIKIGGMTWDDAYVSGAQIGVVNVSKDLSGLSLGALNYCYGNMAGAQIGVFNAIDGVSSGVQLGVFNAAQNLTAGVQIGLFNINVEGKLPLMVLVNANF